MNLPGFTADMSLYVSSQQYRTATAVGSASSVLSITVVDVWRRGSIASGNGKSGPWLDEFCARLTNATPALMSKSLGKAVSKPTSAILELSKG